MFAAAFVICFPAAVDNAAAVFYPCFVVSWGILIFICCTHEGSWLPRFIWGLLVTFAFFFVGAFHYGEVDRNEVLRKEIRSDIAPLFHTLDSKIDPLQQPIEAGTATVEINLAPNTTKPWVTTHYMDAGAFVAFGNGDAPLLIAGSQDSFSTVNPDGSGTITAVCQSPASCPFMGHPVSGLSDAKYIQINFNPNAIPVGAVVTGGSVKWVINNSSPLTFLIPQQSGIQGPQSSSQLRISDLSDGLKPLSSVPDK